MTCTTQGLADGPFPKGGSCPRPSFLGDWNLDFGSRYFESGAARKLVLEQAGLALLETHHMSGQLGDEVVAEINHINEELTVVERFDLRQFIDKVLKYGKASLTLPGTLNSPAQSMTVVFDGIWFFSLEDPTDGAPLGLAEADELVILSRVATFIQRRVQAQKDLKAGQRPMKDMLELIYSGAPKATTGGKTVHPMQTCP